MLRRISTVISALRGYAHLVQRIGNLERQIEALKGFADVRDELYNALQLAKKDPSYWLCYEKERPLVSVCTATYNRAELVTERAVKSILAQSYTNLEVIVVGDGCTDDTRTRLSQVLDSRLRFVNLEKRGEYPDDPQRRWQVAGTTPANYALSLAQGDFVTHLDDDDFHPPDRIERLVDFIKHNKADVVYHPFEHELPAERWVLNEAEDFTLGCVTTSSVLYHHFFKMIRWDIKAHLLDEPGDWNRFRKFKFAGAKTERYPIPLLKHYRERNR